MKAFIRKIEEIRPISGRDRIQEALVQGCWTMVSKESKVGGIGVFFEVDGIIDESFLFENSLYADKEKNKDKNLKGYFPNNGRIRALKFSFGMSNGMFMGLDSLKYLNVDLSKFKENQDISTFKLRDGKDFILVVKYEPQETSVQSEFSEKKTSFFPEHLDTEHFFRNRPHLPVGSRVIITNKMHGTSARYGNLPKWNIKGIWGKVLRYFPFYWKRYVGTRRVQLKRGELGWHGSNEFRYEILNEMDIPKGYAIYGEIVGYANGKPIMSLHDGSQMGKDFEKKFGKDITYNYGCKAGEFKFYVYRVTRLNEENIPFDLPYAEMVQFCKSHGLKTPMLLKEFVVTDAREIQDFVKQEIEKYEDPQFPEIPREGVVVRVENDGELSLYKEKTFAFKVHFRKDINKKSKESISQISKYQKYVLCSVHKT